MAARDAETVLGDINYLVEKYSGKSEPTPTLIENKDYERAANEARRMKRPLLLYFADDSPASLSVNEALLDPSLREFYPRFSTAKMEYVKGSRQALKFNVSRAPTILILDCALEKPEEKPLARIEGSRSVREIRRELEAILPSRDPSAAQIPGAGDAPPVIRPAPEEKLSDDVIERKFIWARVAVAQDTLKRGDKKKALDILEDVLKSYPKHKDTEDVRKVLEEMKKK